MTQREGRITGIYGVWYDRSPGELIKGNGKTLTGVYLLNLDSKRGYKCYANIDTSFTEKMTTRDVYELFTDSTATGIAVLLDEIQKDFNSMAGYTPVKTLVEFCNIASAQTRKRDILLYWTTQRAHDIPLRARVQTDILLQPVRIHADGQRCSTASCSKRHYINVFCREPARALPIVTLDCINVGKLYNTNQVLTDRICADE
jgi:hypothetical protein